MTARQLLQAWAEKRGYRLATAGVGVLDEVRSALEGRRERGEIDADFHRENLEIFTYLEDCPLENPRSVILIAVPRPAHILSFRYKDKDIETILPPTYIRYRPTYDEVRDDLRQALSGTGSRLELLNAPLKSLGASLGILSYGRNNIGYVEGLGSSVQLVGLVSDLLAEEEGGFRPLEEALLDTCRKCRACVAACPTGAIGRDRFLLHAEKCYTLFSESMTPIPEDLKAPSPQCLIGCLKCQEVCPENKGRLRYEKATAAFSAEETEIFLKQDKGADHNEATDCALETILPKFRELGLSENLSLYARNLKLLLNR
jgi:epoxyqueuosine reductase